MGPLVAAAAAVLDRTESARTRLRRLETARHPTSADPPVVSSRRPGLQAPAAIVVDPVPLVDSARPSRSTCRCSHAATPSASGSLASSSIPSCPALSAATSSKPLPWARGRRRAHRCRRHRRHGSSQRLVGAGVVRRHLRKYLLALRAAGRPGRRRRVVHRRRCRWWWSASHSAVWLPVGFLPDRRRASALPAG